tara:strand:+ start:114 stop:365 length:252 start_codon:yes stop_codon:yes gene_type:complete
MNKKTFLVEVKKTIFDTIKVEAISAKDAQNQAIEEMEFHTYHAQIVGAEKLNLKQKLKVISCNPLGGTSDMDNDEFGEYIKNS